mmetsp:Transcript_5302/g.7981  ORF Transcript_5302/g.7981 Transcript_5302/m.7981 type:complete len:206 (-) Transcript_5302:947-1564(-)
MQKQRKGTLASQSVFFFEFIPVSTIAPGLGLAVNQATAGVAGKTAGDAAATVTNIGVTQGVQAGAGSTTSKVLLKEEESEAESSIHSKYSRTRAFLRYLGIPVSSDPLYARWESHRIFLKEMYGAKPGDDLLLMKPTDEQEQLLESVESHPLGVYKLEKLNVSLLWLMWRVYECWDSCYIDLLSEKVSGKENYLKNLREWEKKRR